MKDNSFTSLRETFMKNRTAINAIQGDLFSGFDSVIDESMKSLEKEVLSMSDADVIFYRNFFNQQESDELFQTLFNEIKWRQDKMKIYGKEVNLPRKTAWYGDRDKSYTFSGIHLDPEPWTPTLLQVKEKVEEIAKVRFNSVLLNLYRDGNDGISWHSDAEPELGNNPVIGSVSFGGIRRFMFRHKHNKDLKTEIELTHGSFLFMAGATQHFWQHQIPKTSKKVQPRINLTFRVIGHSR
ncbi:alpha-ketoglutarate-dependent dioxygenase AlkB family protein [Fischerella sp. PCC 9605]|uniref:alpha-ketoglutarate-dependent dioxygenase AlkB family protein n=1 Tax=Fischerella sp. PCC 9605 TaxID=1173024 RepID=UPI0004B72DB9|nr:alpha-ketoglutarate-dependent dioxygenase AlkB [Fischerella sp. PCC 9605]